MSETVFEQIETAWSADAGSYDQGIQSDTSVDGAEGMVERVRINIKKEALNAKVYKNDAVLLDTEKENSFDAIISRDVAWTLYDPEKAAAQFRRQRIRATADDSAQATTV